MRRIANIFGGWSKSNQNQIERQKRIVQIGEELKKEFEESIIAPNTSNNNNNNDDPTWRIIKQNLRKIEGQKEKTEVLDYLIQNSEKFKKINTLSLSDCGLTELPKSIKELKDLTSLELRHNKLQNLPNEITQLSNLKKLDLRYNKIKSIPNAISKLSNLKALDLSINEIKSIPDEMFFSKLSNLEELNLSDNTIKSIPNAITQLSNLKKLDLRYNKIKSIPNAISKLSNLKALNLSQNEIESIPDEISKLSNLEELNLSGNKINSIPNEITQLSNLKALDLSINKIKSIPNEISKLSNLKALDLSINKIKSIPDEISKLSNLEELNLSQNEIKSIPDEISKLSNLEELDLSINKIKSIPNAITKLSNLKALNLSDNKIKSIPNEISKLSNLKALDLSINKIKSIPDEISKLSNLEELNLSQNEIKSIPDEISKLSNLEELDLSINKIKSIPNAITKLSNLKALNLSDNKIKSIPDEISKLRNLEVLNLSGNKIELIPDSICYLRNKLTYLDLSYNQIQSLPHQIGNLSGLKRLYLASNKLRNIPNSMEHLTRLEELDLRENNLNSIPYNIFRLSESIRIDPGVRITSPLSPLHNVLERLYLRNNIIDLAQKVEADIKTLEQNTNTIDLISYKDQIKRTGFNALREFAKSLQMTSLYNSADSYNKVVVPVLEKLLSSLLSKDKNDIGDTVQSIDTCLGNCPTPVANFILTQYINIIFESLKDFKGEVEQKQAKVIQDNIDFLEKLVVKKQIEQNKDVINAMRNVIQEDIDHGKRNETIEYAEELINLLFSDNYTGIINKKNRSTSLSGNTFSISNTLNKKILKETFLKTVCQTENDGKLKVYKTNERGLFEQNCEYYVKENDGALNPNTDYYARDDDKVQHMLNLFLKELGVLNPEQVLSNQIQKEMRDILNSSEYCHLASYIEIKNVANIVNSVEENTPLDVDLKIINRKEYIERFKEKLISASKEVELFERENIKEKMKNLLKQDKFKSLSYDSEVLDAINKVDSDDFVNNKIKDDNFEQLKKSYIDSFKAVLDSKLQSTTSASKILSAAEQILLISTVPNFKKEEKRENIESKSQAKHAL